MYYTVGVTRFTASDGTGLQREVRLHWINILKLHRIVYIIADFTNYHVDAVDEYPRSDAVDQHFIRCPMQSRCSLMQ